MDIGPLDPTTGHGFVNGGTSGGFPARYDNFGMVGVIIDGISYNRLRSCHRDQLLNNYVQHLSN